jgi:macrolide-specific efflux system membrane fusion protein
MNIKKIITIIIVLILFIDAAVFFTIQMRPKTPITANNYASAAVKDVDSTIIADGTITAQDQADLHFQTAGKLVSLPFKEGDKITQGQTIAQLDTYTLQQELSAALNNYQSTRDAFDQAQVNQNNGTTQKVQEGQDNFYGAGISQYGTNPDTTNYLNDVAKRIVDENQQGLNNSVINVQIANYALQMATLTSPITGVVTHEDVTVAGQNVSPTTTFSVADPNTKVFRANIPASDIDFVSDGMNASVVLDGVQNKISGTITNMYPSKMTLSDGEQVYQVDIQSDDIKNMGKLDQAGSVVIMTNAQNVILVPAWTVLSNKYVWVDNNGTPELKTVTVGSIHGNDIEITGGLTKQDRVITDPKVIPAKNYPIL